MAWAVSKGTRADYYEVVCILKKYWKDSVAITWDYEDVQWQAAMIIPGKMLSDKGVEAVLFHLLNNHDVEVGVNWDTIAYSVREHMDYLVDDPCGRGE